MTIWVVPLSLVATWVLTGWVLRCAHVLRLIDLPNVRSSHTLPTPRGGGLAIAIVCTVLLLLREFASESIDNGLLGIAVGGVLVAVLGFLDDRYSLSAKWRFVVQAAVVVVVVVALGGLPDEARRVLPWITTGSGVVLCAVVVLWFLNLFNFMDGIDGIAASQGVFMAGGAALLAGLHGATTVDVTLLGGIAASSLGFLIWNRPPARIFMGDVGSAYLGYLLPMLGIWLSRESVVNVWSFIVLGTLFIGDASATLLRRSLSGYRWHEAHRSHVYQRLARRFGHARITLAYALVNVALVLPLAWMTARETRYSAAVASVTTVASLVVFWRLGAGCGESPGDKSNP